MLQLSTASSVSINTTVSNGQDPTPSNETPHDSHPSYPEGQEIDNPAVEKRRFELCIYLIWVGIISNPAQHISDQAFDSDSTFGIDLQEFMSKYHTNDLVERLFVVGIFILAMLYGNNASYLLDSSDSSNIAIIIFLVVLGSFIVVEAAYSRYIASLRREIALRVAFAALTLPSWIPATFITSLTKAAIILEYLMSAFMATPPPERLLRQDHFKNFDSDHWAERIQDFLIIILGEGVLSIIKGSPLGRGITNQAGNGVLALIAYYVLSGFYFNGDQSRRYVHTKGNLKISNRYVRLLPRMLVVVIVKTQEILGTRSNPLVQESKTSGEEEHKEVRDLELELAFTDERP
ncbi:MAG: hypothetical protein ASARMPRED_001725 [Alectoria sarmentosa]|nr:MAG: hypothetical protein ASARMPRED_001725 [Alectoria sarmentosa]